MVARFLQRLLGVACLSVPLLVAIDALAQDTVLIAGQNINMVAGTQWPGGDPYLNKQNEGTMAVSARNDCHLMGGSNDYRAVDLPGLPDGKTVGDSWPSVYVSTDCGGSWYSTLIPGYPQDDSDLGATSPASGVYEAGADPVVRSGASGLLHYSGIFFTRADDPPSAGFVATYIDLNNSELGSPFGYIGTSLFDQNADGLSFIDKPWIAVDKPRSNPTQFVDVYVDDDASADINVEVECGNLYVAYARIQGDGTVAVNTQIMFARSLDCGQTFSAPIQLSLPNTINQGAVVAVEPNTGRVQVAWRQFENATMNCTHKANYWRDNQTAWPVDEIELAGLIISKNAAGDIIVQAEDPDDYAILGDFEDEGNRPGGVLRQLLAAWLNILSGADSTYIELILDQAEDWLVDNPLGSEPKKEDKDFGSELRKVLRDFNQGSIGPGDCDDLVGSGLLSGLHPNAIMVTSSTDFGETFSAPVSATDENYFPYEQGTTPYSFRTLGFPTMTIDHLGRSYIAVAARGFASADPDTVGGDARIAVTTSMNGIDWTPLAAIDDDPGVPGHQIMPALDYHRGKLFLLYYDFRQDVWAVHDRFIVDYPIDTVTTIRHTTDVRAAIADPGAVPQFTDYTSVLDPQGSTQASRYPFLVFDDGGTLRRQQLKVNSPNFPVAKDGSVPFFGDYLDLASQDFYFDETTSSWEFDNQPLDSLTSRGMPVVQAVWTDNRDIIPPPDGDWTNWVPPIPSVDDRDVDGDGNILSRFDGTTVVDVCTAADFDRTQMRNQNIYTSRLTQGLVASIPGNNRALGTIQRVFVGFVQNTTSEDKLFRLTILNQPPGGNASFDQFGVQDEIIVLIRANSSIARSIFVTSTDTDASVDIAVQEVIEQPPPSPPGTYDDGELYATMTINPDPSAPVPDEGGLLTEEVYRPAIFNPAIFNPAIFNAALLGTDEIGFNASLFNPAIFNPAIFNDPVQVSALQLALSNPAIFNPAIFNPAIFNPAIFNPAIFNPAIFNPAIFNPAIFNPAIFNPAIFNPAIFNPAIFNPAIFNPAIFNPAIFNPAIFNPAIFNGAMSEASVVVTNTGNATAAYSLNLDLDEPPAGFLYQITVFKNYLVPSVEGCGVTEQVVQQAIVNDFSPALAGDLGSPDSATSFYVDPGDYVVVQLRIITDPAAPGDPNDIDTLADLDLAQAVVPQAVETLDIVAGKTTPTPVGVATECDVLVAGTGSEATDVDSLDAAINGPHSETEVTVCLDGTFDFGTAGFVAINPVSTVDELNIVGRDGATIQGGFQPLRHNQLSTLPRLSIRDLRFEDPLFTAISIFRGNDLVEITGVEIDGVLTAFVPALSASLREGIVFTTPFAEIGGVVEITNNTIDGGSYDPVGDLMVVNAGIGLYGLFAGTTINNTFPFTATAHVADNVISNWSGSGIALISLDNALIEDNTVTPGAFANAPFAFPVCAAGALGYASGIGSVGLSNSVFDGNTINLVPAFEGDGDPACNTGILLISGLLNATSNTFTDNVVAGLGSYGLRVGNPASTGEEFNDFLNNDLSLTASGASLFIGPGANNNTFTGAFPDGIEGNAAGNTITIIP